MNKEYELMSFMLSSARGLYKEPKSYGPLRLYDAARYLSEILIDKYPENTELKELRNILSNRKDAANLEEELDEAILKLVEMDL